MKNNESPHECSLCKGQCCKTLAGSYTPEDIGVITVDHILALLKTGKYAIDWWEGDARFTFHDMSNSDNLSVTRYLRPRHVDTPAITGDYAPQTCVNLTDKGCGLLFKDRPYQCKALIPNFNKTTMEHNCIIKPVARATRQEVAVLWVPYQDILEEAISRYEGEKDQ